MIAAVLAIAAMSAAALVAVRFLAGPTLYDRLLAAHSIAVKAAVIAAAAAVIAKRVDWLDAAIAVALALLVLQVAVAKYFRARSFQPPMARHAGGEP